MSQLVEMVAEAQRELAVCNACRYCEGFCAVFPAIERRTEFGTGDVIFLANLCHDCRGCFQACMYTKPHELAIDIPSLMSSIRGESYQRYAWPGRMAWAFSHNASMGIAFAILGVALVLLEMLATGRLSGFVDVHTGPGAFYALVPWLAMLIPALASSAFIALVLIGGMLSFWRETHGKLGDLASLRAWAGAAGDAARLRYLDGGGPGCYYPAAESHSHLRRVLHQLVVFGFLSDLVSTILAGINQDLLGIDPPFPILSPTVSVGILGGVALVIGCTGLLSLKLLSDTSRVSHLVLVLDYAFVIILDLAALSGLLLVALRGTWLLGLVLTAHLGLLVSLYFTFPYGKFVHGVYRFAALVKNRLELDHRSATTI